MDGDHNSESSGTGPVGQETVPAFGSGGVAPWGRLRGGLQRGRFSGLVRSVIDRSFRPGGRASGCWSLLQRASRVKASARLRVHKGLKPPLEKDRKRPSGEGGGAADPGVNTGSNTLRARPPKRPPRKGTMLPSVSRPIGGRLQICLASPRLPITRPAYPASCFFLLGRNSRQCAPEFWRTIREGAWADLNPIALQPWGARLSQVT